MAAPHIKETEELLDQAPAPHLSHSRINRYLPNLPRAVPPLLRREAAAEDRKKAPGWCSASRFMPPSLTCFARAKTRWNTLCATGRT